MRRRCRAGIGIAGAIVSAMIPTTIGAERPQPARLTIAQTRLANAIGRAATIHRLVADQRGRLDQARTDLARAVAALEAVESRPAIAMILQPGSLDDLVHMRAVFAGVMPSVRTRVRVVRFQRAALLRIEADAALSTQAVRDARLALDDERMGALAPLPESARLGSPVAVRHALAGVYRLPVTGRLVTGFDAMSDAGVRARGLTFAVAAGLPVMAPAAGRVRYAGRFHGFGTIVILDHGHGWTTLLAGLERASVAPGAAVRMSQPVGYAGGGGDPQVTVELRHDGRPVNIAPLVPHTPAR